jgi:hypothetical protein
LLLESADLFSEQVASYRSELFSAGDPRDVNPYKGTRASSRGNLARRGARYHHAASAYAARENVN